MHLCTKQPKTLTTRSLDACENNYVLSFCFGTVVRENKGKREGGENMMRKAAFRFGKKTVAALASFLLSLCVFS